MVRKSYGKMRGARKKIRSGDLPVSRYIDEFKPGDNISVRLHSSFKLLHPKFQGVSGKIVEKRGNAYRVRIKNKKAYKEIFVKPEHLKKGC